MKIDTTSILTDIWDKEIIQNGKPLQIKSVIVEAILTPLDIDKNEKQEKKLERYELAKRCTKGGVIEFKVEELAEIKKRINIGYPNPIILGQLNDIIEGKNDQHNNI